MVSLVSIALLQFFECQTPKTMNRKLDQKKKKRNKKVEGRATRKEELLEVCR